MWRHIGLLLYGLISAHARDHENNQYSPEASDYSLDSSTYNSEDIISTAPGGLFPVPGGLFTVPDGAVLPKPSLSVIHECEQHFLAQQDLSPDCQKECAVFLTSPELCPGGLDSSDGMITCVRAYNQACGIPPTINRSRAKDHSSTRKADASSGTNDRATPKPKNNKSSNQSAKTSQTKLTKLSTNNSSIASPFDNLTLKAKTSPIYSSGAHAHESKPQSTSNKKAPHTKPIEKSTTNVPSKPATDKKSVKPSNQTTNMKPTIQISTRKSAKKTSKIEPSTRVTKSSTLGKPITKKVKSEKKSTSSNAPAAPSGSRNLGARKSGHHHVRGSKKNGGKNGSTL